MVLDPSDIMWRAGTDLDMMNDPPAWPFYRPEGRYSILPIKRYAEKGKPPVCAMLIWTNEGKYHFVAKGLGAATWSASDMEDTTPEALVADGWLVD